jgi:hypothetical protein
MMVIVTAVAHQAHVRKHGGIEVYAAALEMAEQAEL